MKEKTIKKEMECWKTKIKTQKEIVDYIKKIEKNKNDLFGVMKKDLIAFLDYKHASHFLKKCVSKNNWNNVKLPLNIESIIKQISDYMPFAWEKANDMRGLSVLRSIDHMRAWLWLLNDGSLEKMEKIKYEHYGKEKLIFICEHLGIDWRQYDDGARTNEL